MFEMTSTPPTAQEIRALRNGNAVFWLLFWSCAAGVGIAMFSGAFFLESSGLNKVHLAEFAAIGVSIILISMTMMRIIQPPNCVPREFSQIRPDTAPDACLDLASVSKINPVVADYFGKVAALGRHPILAELHAAKRYALEREAERACQNLAG